MKKPLLLLLFPTFLMSAPVQKDANSWIADALAVSLSASVWNLDTAGCRAIINQFMKNESAAKITVTAADGSEIYSADKNIAGEKIKYHADIFNPDKTEPIASLELQLYRDSFSVEAFERQLFQMRYTLYPYLYSIDVNKIQKLDFGDDDKLKMKVSNFMSEHNNDIFKYRLALLWNHIGKIDLSSYAIKDLGMQLNEQLKEMYAYFTPDGVLALNNINPFYFVNALAVAITGRDGTQNIMQLSIISMVATPHIVTEKVSDDEWIIYYDQYRTILMCRYNVATGRIVSIVRFGRK